MYKHKILSFVLAFLLVFNITIPTVYAQDFTANNVPQRVKSPITDGVYTLIGDETPELRYNILLNHSDYSGQFALVNLSSPDYVYEYVFNIKDIDNYNDSNNYEIIKNYCFSQRDSWNEIYLPAAVQLELHENTQIQAATADSYATYFKNWLINKYGNEYSGRQITTKTKNGITMYLKSGFQAYSYRDRTYLISATITVLGFVTGILGLAASATALSAISFIVGTGGLLTMGQKVYEYVVRANWFKYATVVSGSGYPYGLCDKFTFYTGYAYTGTGTCNVDEASASTSYVPSSTVYNSNTNIFNNAFDEYNRIGYQSGNF